MTKNRQEQVYKALRERADDCPAEEFKALLLKFGSDEKAVEALEKAVEQRARYEDSGDWTSSASRGYALVVKKQAILRDFYLASGPFGDGQETPKGAATLKELREEVRLLTERVRSLEDARPIVPIKPVQFKPKPPAAA